MDWQRLKLGYFRWLSYSLFTYKTQLSYPSKLVNFLFGDYSVYKATSLGVILMWAGKRKMLIQTIIP